MYQKKKSCDLVNTAQARPISSLLYFFPLQFDREHFSEVFVDLKWFESKVGNKYLNEAAGLAAEKESASKNSNKKQVCCSVRTSILCSSCGGAEKESRFRLCVCLHTCRPAHCHWQPWPTEQKEQKMQEEMMMKRRTIYLKLNSGSTSELIT